MAACALRRSSTHVRFALQHPTLDVLCCRALLGSLIWMQRWTSSARQASRHSEGEEQEGVLSLRAQRSV